jgi:hypothetical protein
MVLIVGRRSAVRERQLQTKQLEMQVAHQLRMGVFCGSQDRTAGNCVTWMNGFSDLPTTRVAFIPAIVPMGKVAAALMCMPNGRREPAPNQRSGCE